MAYFLKQCPACNSFFNCNANDIQQCGCYAVQLTATQKKLLALGYTDCLCNHCLSKLPSQLREEGGKVKRAIEK